MKYLLFASLILAFFACSHPVPAPDFKTASYDTSKTLAVFYFTDTKLIKYNLAPAKRVERHYFAQDGFDSTTMPGKYILKVKPIIDTIYIIATTDSTLIMKDSTGKEILDSGKKVQYKPSFRKPLYAPKQIVQEAPIITFKDVY